MELNINRRKKFVQENELDNPRFHKTDSIGFWGYVTEVHSDTLTVNVTGDNGFEYFYIPVSSGEWVNSDIKSGSRYLPPVNSRVFVLMPTKTIQSAFVLCSGFGMYESEEKAGFNAENDKDDINKKNSSIRNKKISGWEENIDTNTGNYDLVSKDGKISIHIQTDKIDDVEKNVSLTAWGTEIKIENGKVILNISNQNVELSCSDVNINSDSFNINCDEFTINKSESGSDFSVVKSAGV